MAQIPYVIRDNKPWFYHRAQAGETQRYCSPALMANGPDPDKYTLTDQVPVPLSPEVVESLDAATQAVLDLEAARQLEIVAAQDNELKRVTLDQAQTFVRGLCDTATLDAMAADLAAEASPAVLAALTELRNMQQKQETILLAMLPYILPVEKT